MRFSEEKIRELKGKVRFEMAKNPNASILEIQAILEDYYGHKFDKNFINKLKNKVHRERLLSLNFASLNADIADFQDLVWYGKQHLAEVIFDDNNKHPPQQKINAYKTAIWAVQTLIQMKLNAGIYEQAQKKVVRDRPLSPEDKAILDKALNYAIERGKD